MGRSYFLFGGAERPPKSKCVSPQDPLTWFLEILPHSAQLTISAQLKNWKAQLVSWATKWHYNRVETKHNLLYMQHNLLYMQHNLLYMQHNLLYMQHSLLYMSHSISFSSTNPCTRPWRKGATVLKFCVPAWLTIRKRSMVKNQSPDPSFISHYAIIQGEMGPFPTFFVLEL